jgi:hypothetical protein
MEEAYPRFSVSRQNPPPWTASEIEAIVDRIKRRLDARGPPARSRDLEKLGRNRAERAINLLGPHLLPLISRAEVRLSGARPIDIALMPAEWRQHRLLDRYELVGIVDMLSHIELAREGAENWFVAEVTSKVASPPQEFEVIVDYKGMRRPAVESRKGRLGLSTYESQLQNYAYLRERQRAGAPVVAGVLIFLNELLPTAADLQAWRSETEAGVADLPIPFGARWRRAQEVPDDMKLRRAIHLTAVTPESRDRALQRFDSIVRNIEARRALEAAGRPISEAGVPNPEDKATCDACDERASCPGLFDEAPPWWQDTAGASSRLVHRLQACPGKLRTPLNGRRGSFRSLGGCS